MILIVIPARLESTRLPHKALAEIEGKPMLWWTWQKALGSKLADRVVIATDSKRIQEIMQAFGADCLLTSNDCQSGSDRVYEISQQIPEAQILVNLQGDEPLMESNILDGTIQTLLDQKNFAITTAAIPFTSSQNEPHQVKVVCNQAGRALYFSRAPLAGAYLHLGLYAFRKETLAQFCSIKSSKLEYQERLEQLRAYEEDLPIGLFLADSSAGKHFGVDTFQDLEKARTIIKQTILIN